MAFRILLLVFLASASHSLAAVPYEIMPGKYIFEVTVDDEDEDYPVKIILDVADSGQLTAGFIEYPTYGCKANVASSKQTDLTLTIREEMVFGYDTCIASDRKSVV